jgi:ABC-2 type transport system ATP-binding protein
MITATDIIKNYSGKEVVNIPSLTVELGETVGIVGNNGAGKTTFFRLLLDLVRADTGQIRSKEEIVNESEEWKKYTAAYLDQGFLIEYLTPEEYFAFIAQLNSLSAEDVKEFLVGFEAFFDGAIINSGKYIRDLSNGNQFKTGIAGCLLQKPEVLILDEPFANLDPTSQMRLVKMLKEIHAQRKMTIFISSHDLNHITDVCSRILLMDKGKIVRDIATKKDTLKELEEYFKV